MDDETVNVSESDLESLSASFHITDSEPASVPETTIQPATSQQILDVGEIYASAI